MQAGGSSVCSAAVLCGGTRHLPETQAQSHVWDLAEYKRVEPTHCPTGATSGETGGERKLMWACFVLLITGVLQLGLTGTYIQVKSNLLESMLGRVALV